MLVSVFILLFCAASAAYWLRLAVNTILDRERASVLAANVAEANRLEFLLVRQTLESASELGNQGQLAEALRHDFMALTYLLRFAATVNVGSYTREERLLVADFHLMRGLHMMARSFSPRLARFALLEMTSVLEYFAAVMSRRMSSFSLDLMKA